MKGHSSVRFMPCQLSSKMKKHHLITRALTIALAAISTLLAVPRAQGQVTVANSGFDTPTVSTYQQSPSGASWTFANNAGISNGTWGGSGFGVVGGSNGQFAYIQTGSFGVGSISQNITFPVPGTYTLQYRVAGRSAASQGFGNCTYTAAISSSILSATGSTTTDQPFTTKSHSFTVATAGTYTLSFTNTSSLSGDDAFYVDTVTVSRQSSFVGAGSNLTTGRRQHTATLLPNGKVLVVGGQDENGVYFASAELYDPANGTWATTGSLASVRSTHTATLLHNGKVLVAGGSSTSAEIYDPASGTWTTTGSLATNRRFHTATLLANGKVLVAGGTELGASGYLASAELYDPEIGTWTATGSLALARRAYTATLLANGRVLVAGGHGSAGDPPRSAELYDPASGTWVATGSLILSRYEHTATLLPNGMVLVAGGPGLQAELYNPASGTWQLTGSLATSRDSHTATLQPNGTVLVAGGGNSSPITSSAELYDPATGIWSAASNLNTARVFHTATLLPNGKTLMAGGQNGNVLTQSEIYDPAVGTWAATGNLNVARANHTSTLLANGKVLVAGNYLFGGSVDLYDPANGTWTATGSLAQREYHTATLLPNGKVLVAGGFSQSGGTRAGADLYDPASGTWTATGSLITGRYNHTATLLPNGKVLVAGGGFAGGNLNSAELYDPETGTWTATGSLNGARFYAVAALLPNGKVLVAAGLNGSPIASAELYDPATGTWTTTGSLATPRYRTAMTLLPNGKVLVTAGLNNFGTTASAELYNPASGTWAPTGNLAEARRDPTATLLPNGKVLVAGGVSDIAGLSSTELYDPAIGTWRASGSLITARYDCEATLLASGKVLIAGGANAGSGLNSAELYDVGLNITAGSRPQITAASFNGTGQLVVTGTGFNGVSGGSGGGTSSDSPTNYPVVQLRWLDNGQSDILSRNPGSNATATAFTSAAGVNTSRYGYALVTVFANGIPSTAAIVLSPLPAPDITVEQPAGTSLSDNVSTVNYGAVLAGTTSDRVFTIKNPGTANLTGLGITINGTHASEFSVIANPTPPVVPAGNSTFTVRFSPLIAGGTGTRNAALHIASNVSGTKNPFSINLAGIAAALPTVTSPTSATITATGATLGGNVTGDGAAAISQRGVVYSVTATNSNPLIGGAGVTTATASGTTGVFTVPVAALVQGTAYTFKAYATNSQGTSYTSAANFTTLSTNADLSALSLGSGTLSPAFASGTTSYIASVSNATASITVTPTRAQANATIEARVNGGSFTAVTSGSPSGVLALNIGSNTIDIRVTAQAGTAKTYTVTVTRDKATQTITGFSSPGPQLATATVNLSATGGGSLLPVVFSVSGPASLDGNAMSFTGPGSVTIRANQAGNDNYHAATEVAHTFAVSAAPATVNLTGLGQVYDGSVKSAGATTAPAGLPVSIVHTPDSPINAGDYGIVATVTDPRYAGSASGNLVIAKATQSITGFANPGDQIATDTVNLSAAGGASGMDVIFTADGPAEIDGGNVLTFTGPGAVTVRANQAGNGNYEAAPEVAYSFTVTAATVTVTLSRLHQVADGTAREVVATTVPADQEVVLSYEGDPEAPTAPGSYEVSASLADARYEGEATETLVVDDPARSVTVPGGTLPALSALGELVVPTFQIGAYEVTGSQWTTIVAWAEAEAGYDFVGAGAATSGDRPVTGVSWSDAVKWCNARTEWENMIYGRSLAPAYRVGGAVFKTGTPTSPDEIHCDFGTSGHRLPTAAEWEFAARSGAGGATSTYPGGDTLEDLGWFADNSEGAAQPAGGKTANGLGLYDLAGNAAEWTWDAPSAAPAQRLLRGGSWSSLDAECALEALNGANPALSSGTAGFRLARSVSLALAKALDHPDLTWDSGGDEPWFAQTGTTHDGEDAAESGPLSQSQTSWVETTVEGPGNLRFRWKTEGGEALDVLNFSIDGSSDLNRSGTGDWEEQLVEISEGSHILRWTYLRGSDVGAARTWLDAVDYETATEPSVTTTAASEVTLTGATLGGEVTNDGGREIPARGVVHATATAPTLDNGTVLTADEGGIGTFAVIATGLAEGTTYFARAYATNNLGTTYGEEVVFTTGSNADFDNGVATFSRTILPGGRQLFHFTLAGPRIVSLSTLGGAALRAELYDSEGKLIATFTGDADFDLEELLLAGAYALHVFREEDGGAAQAFDLTIDASTVAVSRPDVAVGSSADRMLGRHVYGGRQQAHLVSKKDRPVTGHVRVGNRGNLPDVLSVRGNPGNAFFAVTYFAPGNVTAAMRTGTHRTPTLVDGEEAAIRVVVTPNKKKLTKKQGRRTTILRRSLTLAISASSTFDPAQRDSARLKVRTARFVSQLPPPPRKQPVQSRFGILDTMPVRIGGLGSGRFR